MKRAARLIAGLAVAALAGCQAYHARPLTADAVGRALAAPSADTLRVEAAALQHPILPPVTVDLSDGLSPDEAAVVAVLVNPSLRAARDGRSLADAQLLQAGILPNPTLSTNLDVPVAGNTTGTSTGMGAGVDWDLKALVGRRAGVQAAQASRAAVDLDVAWQEWQVAQAARLAVYNLLALDEAGGAGPGDEQAAGGQPGPGAQGRQAGPDDGPRPGRRRGRRQPGPDASW